MKLFKKKKKDPLNILEHEKLMEAAFCERTLNPEMPQYWKGIMEQPTLPDARVDETIPDYQIVDQSINVEDVARLLKTFDEETANWPDSVKVNNIKKLGTKQVTYILNGIVRSAVLPAVWKVGRTTLIEKEIGASNPGDFRPLTICSVWSRLLSKALAEKITASTEILPMQRGFQKMEGVGEALLMSDLILRDAKKIKDITLTFLEFSKAFDSVARGYQEHAEKETSTTVDL